MARSLATMLDSGLRAMQIRSYLLRVLIPLCLLFAGGQVSGADQPPPPDAQQTSETAPASRRRGL